MPTGKIQILILAAVFTFVAAIASAQQEVLELVTVSGALQAEPAPISGGFQVEPTPVSAAVPKTSPPGTIHRFWDRENDLWFAGVGAARVLDYASTLNLRRRGLDEIFLTNSIVDNHALFGGIEAAAAAASIGISYLFHRTGHHRLERWTSIVHFGLATGGAARNYALKTHRN